MEKKKFRLLPLLVCIVITLSPGLIVGLLTSAQTDIYSTVKTPAFAPPAILFPIVWGLLYTLMGVSLYLIYQNHGTPKNYASFGIQFVFNLIWPFLFFSFESFWFAFVWLVILWITILFMIVSFYQTYPVAAYLQIPYLLWVTFAGMLNLAIAILN